MNDEADSRSPDSARSLDRWRDGWQRFLQPRPDGLPRVRVLLAFPALLLLLMIGLVAAGINGSSSGAFHSSVSAGVDPNLLAGHPEMIRTDEWNVQTVWAIAQAEQGLPVENQTFPGGMDATIPQDMPRADWSVAFRPHLLGFFGMNVDHALTLKWWLPALSLLAAAYAFVVTILPRRPLIAAGIAVAFYFSPFFQWWFLQTTWWPVVWGLATMSAITWALRSRTRAAPIVWGIVVAYLTVVMAMGIYVPFIVPVALVVLFYGIFAIVEARSGGASVWPSIRRLWPIAAAAIVGAATTGAWLLSKSTTVQEFLGTAYPGDRLERTGSGDLTSLASGMASSFSESLKAGGFLGANSSEASTFFFVGAMLIPVVIWLIVRRTRAGRLPWMAIGASLAILLFVAFIFVPGWDPIAHLLFLDRTITTRVRIGIGLASIVVLVALIRDLDKGHRPGWMVSIGTAGLYLASQVIIAVAVLSAAPTGLDSASHWWVFALASTGVIILAARAYWGPAIALFAAVAIASSATVNPIYHGVYDLRETPVAQRVMAIDDASEATWIALGGRLPTAILLESGVEAFNGFQGAPAPEMWELVDPSGAYEFEWNRLAGVSWTPGPGEPTLSNPAPDQILATFDACSAFAQKNVEYVLSDSTAEPDSTCLDEVASYNVASGPLTIWQIVPQR